MKVKLSSAHEVFGKLLYVEGGYVYLSSVNLDIWIDCEESTLTLKAEHNVFGEVTPGVKKVTLRRDPERYIKPGDPVYFGEVATLKRTILTLKEALSERVDTYETYNRCIKSIHESGFPVVVAAEDLIAFNQAKDDERFYAIRVSGLASGELRVRSGWEDAGGLRKELSDLTVGQLTKALELGRWFQKISDQDFRAVNHSAMIEECLNAHIIHAVSRQSDKITSVESFHGKKYFIVELPFGHTALVSVEGQLWHNHTYHPHQFKVEDNSLSGQLGVEFDLSDDTGAFTDSDVDDMPDRKQPRLLMLSVMDQR